MAEYDLGFAAKLAQTADMLDERESDNYDARRVMVYLSRVSMEIAMKALLEQAGMPTTRIKRRNHDLNGLLEDLGHCEVLTGAEGEEPRWTSAAAVRDLCIDMGLMKIPIGDFIASTHPNVSRYPNQVRYGATVIDFQPTFLVRSAGLLAAWAQAQFKDIRMTDQKCA